MDTIPYARQDISKEDINAAIAVLKSDFLTQGPMVPSFEKAVMDYCGSQYAVAVNSATSALHIACLALGVGKGDVVWTSPITFVASANCALYCDATIDFVDIDPFTYNLSTEKLAEKLAFAESIGNLPKVLICVHLCGQSCDMSAIHKLIKQYKFKIIEDASHAIGGKYKNNAIGNCHFSDITVFSFHPVKIITTGEGGMAVTNDITLAKEMRLLRSHGISAEKLDFEARPMQEIWNYQQIKLGFNYRMTDIGAALGLSQMNRLDEFVSKRNGIAKRYNDLLSNLPLVTPFQHEDSYSSYHLYIIRLKLNEIKKTQRQIFEEIYAAGILINLHYIPIYRQPYYRKIGFKSDYCQQADKYYSEAISIPMYSGLTIEQQNKVITVISDAVQI